MFLDPSLLVRAANTTINVAAESLTMLQCNDIRHCCTLQSIIFGCFSTVFLCTWTALHHNIPYPPLLTRVGWMLLALLAPEFIFMKSFNDWTSGSDLLAKILKNYPECGWTETHAQFVTMGGFRLVDADKNTFLHFVKDGTIELPKDGISAGSKGDFIAKTITIIQTAWFVFQCIHRRSQHLLLTELKITTLAHTLINFFIYFFWWHKPYGVAIPIEVPFRERRPETIGARDGNGTPSMSPQLSWRTQLGIKTSSVGEAGMLSIHGWIVLSIIWFIVGGGFGAMHCLAWNSAFPTRAEKIIWQVSSLIVTVFGGTLLLIGVNDVKESVFNLIFRLIFPLYCVARVSLLVLALLQLRALPYAGYTTPSWTLFYPHIS